jgi:hypothetical protein
VRLSLALGLAAIALAGGCGGGSPSGEDVVRAWSRALNAGDNEAAADLFADGARVLQGDRTIRLATHADAVAFNASLPCSGTIVSLESGEDTVTATFVLGDRPASACDAPGATAAAAFELDEDGKIVRWEQLEADEPGAGPAI